MKKTLLTLTLFIFTLACVFAMNQGIDPNSPNYDSYKRSQVCTQETATISTQPSMAFTTANQGKDFQSLLIPVDGTFSLAMGPNDDGSTDELLLPFTFLLYGAEYNSFWINNNGNITFDGSYYTYTPFGFPIAGYPMLAPFFADVDTRGTGQVWYKIEAHRVIVIWDHVGYYGNHVDRLNTFEVIFTDGTDATIGLGNTVAFSYGDLAWTTGDASEGSGGLGGVAATVGINKGDGTLFSQTGRFDHEGYDYDGAYGNNDGIDWLDYVIFYYNTVSASATLTIVPTTIDLAISGIALPDGVPPNAPTTSAFYASYPLVGNLTVSIPVGPGTWRGWIYYGFVWHQADVFPVSGPGTIVFTNVPFGAKSDVPVIIDGDSGTLPVELSSFSAIVNAQNLVNLTWVTESETGVSGYNIYRGTTNDVASASLASPLLQATNTSQQQTYQFVDYSLDTNGTYYYWLLGMDLDGSSTFFGPVVVVYNADGNGNTPVLPARTELLSAYPNPFKPNTTISYSIKDASPVTLDIFNTRGQVIRSYTNNKASAGTFSIVWDGNDAKGNKVGSGVYFYRMTSKDYISTKKLVVTK